jgi:hypothetical protein
MVRLALALLIACAGRAKAQEPAPAEEPSSESLLEMAKQHMALFEMQRGRGDGAVQLVDRPLLTYGDSARVNKNGTLWAFGASGRPAAILELYQDTGTRWVHAVTLTGASSVTMKTPVAAAWTPAETQIAPAPIPEADAPLDRELRRTRQLKELARRFTAHEFWDPDNSRFELRLLEQPVLRYKDAEAGIQDGAVFVLAHGTNPEVIVLIEAIGKTIEEARWHYSLARLGSAELHVELDGKEVWKQGRTPGIVGRPVDPYWLFVTPVEAQPAGSKSVPAEKK